MILIANQHARHPWGGRVKSFLSESVIRRNRALKELLALVRAVIDDGVVTSDEAVSFHRWLEANPDMTGVPPVNVLVAPLRRIFADQVVTESERSELLHLLSSLAGEDNPNGPEWGRLHREGE
jgi:hypothetical protein